MLITTNISSIFGSNFHQRIIHCIRQLKDAARKWLLFAYWLANLFKYLWSWVAMRMEILMCTPAVSWISPFLFFLLADNVYHRRGEANCFRLSGVGGSIALFRVGHDEFKIVISHV